MGDFGQGRANLFRARYICAKEKDSAREDGAFLGLLRQAQPGSISIQTELTGAPTGAAREEEKAMPNRSHTENPRSQNESKAQINNPDGFQSEKVRNISSVMNALLADVFALYIKTKNFHWHMSGPHFRDYHLLLDEQSEQIFNMTDDIAERVRKVGGVTIHSIGEIARLQRIHDNEENYVDPQEMLRELHRDNMSLVESMRAAHEVTDHAGDFATTSLIENWIDESERRAWFLFESTRQ
jgi:starvation-inducible DNA-binding protein